MLLSVKILIFWFVVNMLGSFVQGASSAVTQLVQSKNQKTQGF